MKSLHKLLLTRFIIIVVAHTLLVLLAVYGITYLNIRNSVSWDVKRFEQKLIDCIEKNQDREQFNNLVSSLNVGEEREIRFAVFENDKLVFGQTLKAEGKTDDLDVSFYSYKKWRFTKISEKGQYKYITSVKASLDFIDDTLWILLLSLPLTLIPAMIFANKSFRAVVEPVREISSTLKNVEQGDLSDRVKGEAKNEEINTLIERMNEALSALQESFDHSERFNANAAHELKTPLATLRGEIDVCLQNERTTEEYEDCLVKCQDEIRHLDEVLKILLLISSPGHTMKDSFKEFDVKESYESCDEIISALADDKNIKLTKNIDSVILKGSPELMKRALFNLLENAVKYSPEGTTVQIELSENSFSVSDSATQIPESQKSEILKPFHRLQTEKSGAGLGLSLVKWIADLHGFSLTVDSSEKGNKFIISFK